VAVLKSRGGMLRIFIRLNMSKYVVVVGNDKHLDANLFDSVVKTAVQLITSADVDVDVDVETRR